MKLRYLPLLLAASFLFPFSSCEDWDLATTNFTQVELLSVDSVALDSALLIGSVKGLTRGQYKGHGFIWTTQQEELTILSYEGIASLGVKTSEEPPAFSAAVKLAPNTHYTFRAYAEEGQSEYTYSERFSYRTSGAEVSTLGLAYQSGFSLELKGQLSGMESGIIAEKHGFCWSASNPEPTLADGSESLGNRRDNEVFNYSFEGLENNVPFYFRAFAVFSNNPQRDTLYGEVVTFDGDLNFWDRKADFLGRKRSKAFGFTIRGKGYLGGGVGFGETPYSLDFWEYDPEQDVWTQKSDYRGFGPIDAVGFPIDSLGYAGTGTNGEWEYFSDFWEYNPQTNIWLPKEDFGGGPRAGAVGFSVEDKGYVGTGATHFSSVAKDFWEYDPQADSWKKVEDFGGGERNEATAFSIDGKGYVGTGIDPTQTRKSDFWEYDPQADTWIQKISFPGDGREGAVGFSISSKGYLGTGWTTHVFSAKDFWEYDPLTDRWARKADVNGLGRNNATGFSIGPKGYLGTGRTAIQWGIDFWEFEP